MEHTPDNPESTPAASGRAGQTPHLTDTEWQDVFRRMREVASGEMEIVETLNDAEKDLVRRFFAWIADNGDNIQPILTKIAEQIPSSVPGPEFDINIPAVIEALGPGDPVGEAEVPELWVELLQFLDEAGRTFDNGAPGLVLVTLSYIYYDDFHYPQPETGRYDIADNQFDKVKWVYRYWYNQLEVGEHGMDVDGIFGPGRGEPHPGATVESIRPDSGTSGATVEVGSPDGGKTVGSILEDLWVCAAGDLLAVDVLTPENTAHLFDDIVGFFRGADIVSANLESTVYSKEPPGRIPPEEPGKPFRMNTSQAMFNKFRNEAGINFFATATNHANDFGTEGILATLDVLRDSGARFAGTASSQPEQDDVVVVEKATGRGSVKVAFLSYTFDLNGRPVPANRPYLVNEVRFNDVNPAPDYSLVERQIKRARDKGAEFIIAYCHWGWEFEMYPHQNIRDAARALGALGVGFIIGNHPHVSQPMEIIALEESGRSVPVFYGFGDFVSYHPQSRNSKISYIIEFSVTKARFPELGDVVGILDYRCVPIYIVNAPRSDGSYDCRIIRFEKVLANPDDYGLTEREKSELPHLESVVWNKILKSVQTADFTGMWPLNR